MPYVEANNIRLYYEIHGSGTPLILISGLGGDLSFWNASLERLQTRFQLITVDNRGIGRSDAPDMPYSMAMFADDVSCLMEQVGIEKAHVLGFSMGGNIAQEFAIRHPRKLLKLILAASFAKMNRQAELFLDAVLAVYESGATEKQMYNLILPWLFSPRFLSNPANAALLEFDENDPFPQPLYAFKRQYHAQRSFDSRDALCRVHFPTLILAGERDALATVENARELVRLVAHSQLKLIPDAGHLINLEQTEVFHSTIIDFLTG